MTLLEIPEIPLSSGSRSMPVVAMGTFSDPPVGPEVFKQAVLQAIEVGYRHFDTAALYDTEEPLGEAIAEAVERGLIKSREEVFITSKLWCGYAYDNLVLPALQNTLKNLKMEYVDLYLIHWPVSSKPGTYDHPIKKEDFHPMDYKSVWAAMEHCQSLGLTKAIGVSNFTPNKLSHILASATIPPAVNQVEVNPLWQQKKLIDLCKANGILVVAYALLGAAGTNYGSNRIMESEVLKEIAKARGKSVPQVSLRWVYEQGIGLVVKSFNKERMKQNLEIFDWELSEEESQKIAEIPQSRGCFGADYTSVNGPFKTIEEFWEGDL